jgi:hypothetical protein
VTAVARGNYDLIKDKGIKISSPDKFGTIDSFKPHRRASLFGALPAPDRRETLTLHASAF